MVVKFVVASALLLLSGCAVQLADPLLAKPSAAPSPAVPEFSSNEIDNFLTIKRVAAYPAIVKPGESSLLTVDYEDALGRPVGVSWFCDKGTLFADKGERTHWSAPTGEDTVCDCEVTVRSRSGAVRSMIRLQVKN